MPAGRPRKHDRDAIGESLIEWAKKDDSINLCSFCADNLLPGSKLSQWAKEDEEFRQTLELSKHFLGARREKMLNAEQLHVKGYDLNASTYDYFLKEERRVQSEYEASLKKPENNTPTKVTFEVNYGTGNQIEILPKTLPASDSPSP